MVSGKLNENLTADILAGRHPFVSGLPPALGGEDEGPDPHALLESSLAACTLLTAKLYAKRKGWEIGASTVKVAILKEGPETEILRELQFDRNVNPELSAEQKSRLLEIVNKCPIHRLLEGTVKIRTILN